MSFARETVCTRPGWREGGGSNRAWKSRLRIFNLKHAALLALERQVFESVRLVIANSRMVADEIVRWHDFPESRIRIVHNGIGEPIPRIPRQEARRRSRSRMRSFVFSSWAPAGNGRDCDFAIEAVESIGRRCAFARRRAGKSEPIPFRAREVSRCGEGPRGSLFRRRISLSFRRSTILFPTHASRPWRRDCRSSRRPRTDFPRS